MILSCYDISNKRIRITIIQGWTNLLKYVPEFLLAHTGPPDLFEISLSYFFKRPYHFIDIVGIDNISNSIYHRMTLILSGASIIESLEVLRHYYLSIDAPEMSEVLSLQCDALIS